MVLTPGLMRKAPVGGGGAGSEPTYSAGTDTSLLFEDFDSYANLAAVQAVWSPSAETNATQSLQSPGRGGAGKAWRITYHETAGSDADTIISHGVNNAAAQPSFTVCEFWLKTIPGYAWQRTGGSGTGEKTIIFNQGDFDGTSGPRMVWGGGYVGEGSLADLFWGGAYANQYQAGGFDGFGIVFSFDGNFVTGSSGTYWYFQNMNHATRGIESYMNDGSYHQFKIKLTPGTFCTGNSGDGIIETWCDGVQIMKYDGTDSLRAEYQQVLVPRSHPAINQVDLGGPLNAGVNPGDGDQWKDYDDVRIWYRP